ncbi:MAG: Vitamin B12 transporter BtuB [Steroidobacteraceae bacterium]|nr:Vitamin B12 transporter BtuB [Steroidobacteraceae bacterium]
MRSLQRMAIAAAACTMAAWLPPGTALAQDQVPERGRTLDEVVVTAQKRVENIQDVPVVVTVVSGQLLQDTGVRDIKDLTVLTPGLIVTSTTNETSTTARIRGVGTVGDNIGLESSVGVVIDEVYRPRNGVGFGDLGELERIEVLKGPQGTLFGKNTSAGVINVRTAAPQFDFGGTAELVGGNRGIAEGSLSLTGPLVGDKLAGRIFYAHRQHDGFLDVNALAPRTAKEDVDRDVDTARGQLLWNPSDAVSVRLIADWSGRNESCCLGVQYVNGPSYAIVSAISGGGIANPADPFGRRAYANRETPQNIRDRGASAQVDWDLAGGMTFTSVTAWRHWETENGQDADFTGAAMLYRDSKSYTNTFETFTQELRLTGENGRLKWLVGAFYADEDLDSVNSLRYDSQFELYYGLALSAGMSPALVPTLLGRAPGTSYATGNGSFDTYGQNSSSWALFTNNTFSVTDRFDIGLGLRYTNEEKDLDSHYSNLGTAASPAGVGCATARARFAIISALLPPAALPSYYGLGCATFTDPVFNNATTNQSLDEGEWSGTAKLIYHFSDDVMSYASYARGYKAGGFNLDRERIGSPASPAAVIDPDTAFGSETVDSYEIGLKSGWLHNRLALNGAVFYQEYKGFQLNTYTGLQFIVASIPDVTSQGVDLDFLWYTPVAGLTLQGGVTYAETEYGNFNAAAASVPARLPGSPLSFAPKWSGGVVGTYEQPINANLKWRLNVGAKYMSDYNTGSDLNPLKKQDAYALFDARIGIGSPGDSWALELWGRNITDEDYIQVGFDAPLQTGSIGAFLGDPRTFGATFRLKF